MKIKNYLFLLACIGACSQTPSLRAQAPVDVTNQYLANAGFDTNFNYGITTTGNVSGNVINEVSGWDKDMIAVYTVAGTFAYGSGATFNTSSAVPDAGYNGSSGGALALSTGSGMMLRYSQTVTLKSGKYALVSAYYNAGKATVGSSALGWAPEGGGDAVVSTVKSFPLQTWVADTIEFVVLEETRGKIRIGLASVSGTAPANTAKILVDYVKLLSYGVDKTDLNQTIQEAETLYGDGEGIGADALLAQLNAAKEIAGKQDVSLQEVAQATEALAEGIDDYRFRNASTEAPIDMTSYLRNPSFEVNGLEGWINNGMQSQTNTPGQGWLKDGTVYAEKWVDAAGGSTLADASLSQRLTGLPPGKYAFKVRAHSINQSGTPSVTKGTYLYAGMDETLVTRGKEYTVETTVADGTLEVGYKTVSTTANWTGFDYCRLYYCGKSIAIFNELLDRKMERAVADTLSAEYPGYFDIQAYREALEAAKHVEQSETAIIGAILGLDRIFAATAVVYEAYRPLKEAIETLEQALKTTDYPDRDGVEEVIAAARAVYDSPQDQRAMIAEMVETLVLQNEILLKYALLGRDLRNAERLLGTSDYPGKAEFSTAVQAVRAVYEDPAGKDILQVLDDLSVAMTAYLNGRPSNWATIRNGAAWRDSRGLLVQAHGAGFIQVGDTWYMIGEDRSGPWNPDVNMYSTKDFVNWKFERKIIQNGVTHPSLGNGRFIERPKIMYNKKTGKFVVWCHWEQSNYGASEAAVFYCDSVNGPYKFHWAGRPMGIKSRDCNVFVDDDGTAYFISTTEENQHLGLFKLSDDYLSAVEHTRLFSGQSREAPAIVRLGNTYFMIFSACSGWDPNQASYSHSRSLTSGWSGRINIGNSISYDTQPASILTVQGSKGTSYLYVGDRWQDPGLSESKTIMFPIQFSGTSITYTYRQQFDLDLATGTFRETDHTEKRVPKANWKIRGFSSEETSGENGKAANAIDGNVNTKWHTRYSGGGSAAPHFIEVDMGAEYDVTGFLCTPRMDNSSNGLIRSYLLLVSSDGSDWKAVSGGTWLPYAGEVYFAPVTARYFRMVATEGTYACIVEMDMLLNSSPYTPYNISPSYRIGNGSWRSSKEITVLEGQSLTFGPSYSGTIGSWAFYGPGNRMSGTRENTIASVSYADAGVYTAVFTDCYSRSSKVDYTVKVSWPDGVETVESDKTEVSRTYYNLQGVEIPSPSANGIYVVKIVYDDGTTGTEKIRVEGIY